MICKIVQYQLSNLGKAEPGGFARRHLQRCQDCEQYQAKLALLDQELRSAARLAPRPRSASELSMGSRGALPAMAALTCAIAVVALLWKGPAAQEPDSPPAKTHVASVQHLPAEHLPEEAEASHSGQPPVWDLAPIRSLRTRAPMRDELDALRQDGQRGLDALLAIGRKE